MKVLKNTLTRCGSALLLALAAAIPAHAQTPPVNTLTMPFVSLAADTGGAFLTFNGQVTFETQRVADPVAGDVLMVNVIMNGLPTTSNAASAARYTTTINETLVKPWTPSSVRAVVRLPLVWQSGGTDPGPRSATVDWTIFLTSAGAPMTSWINSVVVDPPSPPPPPPPSAGTWVRCAAQGENCYFTGTTTVRYLDPSRSLSGTTTATTLTFCLPQMFGLAFYSGTTGYCEYRTP